jgi:hypothetical protein
LRGGGSGRRAGVRGFWIEETAGKNGRDWGIREWQRGTQQEGFSWMNGIVDGRKGTFLKRMKDEG